MLKNLIDQIQETRVIAERDVERLPANTRAGLISAVNEAKGQLEKLKAQYGTELFKNARGVFVQGTPEQSAAFAAIPSREGESLTADASAMYRRIADRMEKSLANSTHRELKTDHVVLAINELVDIGHELDLREIPMLKIKSFPLLPTYEDLVTFVRTTIRATVGDNLNLQYLAKGLTATAINTGYVKPTTNVIVINSSPDEAEGLAKIFTAGSSDVVIGDDDTVNAEYVAKKLNGDNTVTVTAHNKNKKHKN